MKFVQRVAIAISMVGLLPTIAFSQVYFEDFESSQVGDAVGSTGISSDFSSILIQQNGVNGSNGFEVEAPNLNSSLTGVLPVLFGINQVGDHLTFSVDASVTLSGPGATSFHEDIFGLSVRGDQFAEGRFAVDNDPSTYIAAVVHDNPLAFFSGPPSPVNDIGLINGISGTSDFFRFQIDIVNRGTADYDFTSSIFDVASNTQFIENRVEGINLDQVFAGNGFDPTIATNLFFLDTPVWDSIRFDNIRYQVVSVPEPNALALLALTLPICFRRKR